MPHFVYSSPIFLMQLLSPTVDISCCVFGLPSFPFSTQASILLLSSPAPTSPSKNILTGRIHPIPAPPPPPPCPLRRIISSILLTSYVLLVLVSSSLPRTSVQLVFSSTGAGGCSFYFILSHMYSYKLFEISAAPVAANYIILESLNTVSLRLVTMSPTNKFTLGMHIAAVNQIGASRSDNGVHVL